MFIQNKSDFTSKEVTNHNAGITELYLLSNGTGTTFVEQKGGDGLWKRVPELSFEGTIATIISLRRGVWRVVISGGPMSVEIR